MPFVVSILPLFLRGYHQFIILFFLSIDFSPCQKRFAARAARSAFRLSKAPWAMHTILPRALTLMKRIYSCALKFAVRFACAAGGPARTAPEGLIPLDSLSPLRRELEWQSSLLHLALPAKRMAGRVGQIFSFASINEWRNESRVCKNRRFRNQPLFFLTSVGVM